MGKVPSFERDDEAEFRRQWPHLCKPGPQPINQIPGTPAECIQLAMQGWQPDLLEEDFIKRLAATFRANPDLILEPIGKPIGSLIGALLRDWGAA